MWQLISSVDLTCGLTRCDSGKAKCNLANSHSALGRHQAALVLYEEALHFFRRGLPENHPDIGAMLLRLLM